MVNFYSYSNVVTKYPAISTTPTLEILDNNTLVQLGGSSIAMEMNYNKYRAPRYWSNIHSL